jgi:adenosylmethionine-8-amino-7-oxononanoate aminotransferase
MGGTIDGRNGDHVLLAPPFVVTQGDLGEIVGRLKDSVQAALKTVGWTATPSTRSNHV